MQLLSQFSEQLETHLQLDGLKLFNISFTIGENTWKILQH